MDGREAQSSILTEKVLQGGLAEDRECREREYSETREDGAMVRLSAVEARVLGVLIEKEINTPEYYPLSLNATVNACNQKSSREPVMELA